MRDTICIQKARIVNYIIKSQLKAFHLRYVTDRFVRTMPATLQPDNFCQTALLNVILCTHILFPFYYAPLYVSSGALDAVVCVK
jgi:hypothetical protein